MKTTAFSREKVSEELGNPETLTGTSRYRARELCGSARPVERSFGHSRERKTWDRDHNMVRACRDCGKESSQSVDPATLCGNDLLTSSDVPGFPMDCADAIRGDYRKPHRWYGCSLDAEFGTSRNGNDWNTNHQRKGEGCNIYRKGNNWYPDGCNLDVDGRKGNDWYVDCARLNWKYCQKEDVQYMEYGEFPLNSVHCKKPENHTMSDRNLCVLQEDQLSWSLGHGDSGWRSEPWCESSRPWDFTDNVSGKMETVAFPPRALSVQGSKSGCPRTRTGQSDWSQEWEDEAGQGGGTEVWQRNSFYRRTAPSALRRHRKEQQGK